MNVGSAIFLRKICSRTLTRNLVGNREVLVNINAREKGSRMPFRLSSFQERTSGTAFRRFPSQIYPWQLHMENLYYRCLRNEVNTLVIETYCGQNSIKSQLHIYLERVAWLRCWDTNEAMPVTRRIHLVLKYTRTGACGYWLTQRRPQGLCCKYEAQYLPTHHDSHISSHTHITHQLVVGASKEGSTWYQTMQLGDPGE